MMVALHTAIAMTYLRGISCSTGFRLPCFFKRVYTYYSCLPFNFKFSHLRISDSLLFRMFVLDRFNYCYSIVSSWKLSHHRVQNGFTSMKSLQHTMATQPCQWSTFLNAYSRKCLRFQIQIVAMRQSLEFLYRVCMRYLPPRRCYPMKW